MRALFSKYASSFRTVIIESTFQLNSELSTRARRSTIEDVATPGGRGVVRAELSGSHISTIGMQPITKSRIWWRKPTHWREDTTYLSGGTIISTVRGSEASNYISWLGTVYTHSQANPDQHATRAPLLSDAFLKSGWDFLAMEKHIHCGRDGILVEAKWISDGPPPSIWEWIHKYRLIVDLERGVILHCEGLVDDQPAIIVSANSIEFDRAIDDLVFSYEPPPGTKTIPESFE